MKPCCVILMTFMYITVIFANKIEKKELIDFIKDFLVRLGQPLRVTTSELCWNRANFIALTKLLIANQFQITPSKTKISTFWPHEQQMILLDMSCETATEALINANKTDMLSEPFKWLIIEDPTKETLDSTLEIYIRTKIYIVQKQENGFKVISKYRINSDFDYFTNDIAMWERNKFVYYNQLFDAKNRSNLHGIMLNISVAILNPDTFYHLLDLKDRHIEATTKVTYQLVLHLIEYLNITSTNLYRTTWGYKQPNETYFNGIVGDMQNKSTEIAGSAIIPAPFRVPYIEYVGCFTHTRARFIFRAPSLSSVQNVYILPFDTTVWLASIGIIFIAAVILYIISLWETDSDFVETPKNSVSKLLPTISNMFQLQVGAVCQQGSEAEPIGMAGRVATIVLFISSLFLFTSYSANIVALLQSTSDSIKTLEDLLTSRIELGAENISYNVFFFKVEKNPLKRAIYLKKIAPADDRPHFLSIEDGVRKVKDEFYGFHTEATSIYKIVSDIFNEHEKCSLVEIDFFGFSGPPHFAIRKNTSNAELIKAGYHKLSERGMQRRWHRKIYYDKPICNSQAGTFLSVSLLDCYAPFLIFGTGIACALIVFVIEHMYSTMQTRRLDKVIDLKKSMIKNSMSGKKMESLKSMFSEYL